MTRCEVCMLSLGSFRISQRNGSEVSPGEEGEGLGGEVEGHRSMQGQGQGQEMECHWAAAETSLPSSGPTHLSFLLASPPAPLHTLLPPSPLILSSVPAAFPSLAFLHLAPLSLLSAPTSFEPPLPQGSLRSCPPPPSQSLTASDIPPGRPQSPRPSTPGTPPPPRPSLPTPSPLQTLLTSLWTI